MNGSLYPLRLPELPKGWTWHVSARHGHVSVELIDATRIGQMMFKKANPGQFKEGTPAYERLLANGVHVAVIENRSPRKAVKKARGLADTAWLVSYTREDLAEKAE